MKHSANSGDAGKTPLDFVVAGSAKSGTTALNNMLDQHPKVFMSEIKETNFFVQAYEDTRSFIWQNGKTVLGQQEESDIIDNEQKYSHLFRNAETDSCLGEASPWYLLDGDVPGRIREYSPDCKVIVMLRNPAEVAFANYVHQVRDRAESLRIEDRDQIFDQQRYENPSLHPFAHHLDLPRYGQHLPAYVDTFDSDHLLILVYEEFMQDRRAGLSTVFQFLGLDDNVEIDVESQVNVSGMPKNERVQDLIQGSMMLKKSVGRLVPKKTRRRLRSKIEVMNTGSKVVLDDAMRAKLDALYTEDLHYVEQLLGREMNLWRARRLDIAV